MSDLIDRQAAIDAINKRARVNFTISSWYQYYLGALHDVTDDIKQLPSAQPDKAYEKGWKDGREALRKEIWEDERDSFD